MSGDQTAQILYLVLLAVAVGGWLIAQSRGNMGKMAQQALVWGLIFLGVIAAVGLWGDIRRTTMKLPVIDGTHVEVPRGPDGHFALSLEINGVSVPFLVDTGATNIVLTREDAARVGIDVGDLRYLGEAYTANGVVRTARVTLDRVSLGEMTDRDLRAFVNEGDMDGSLLGMDYLNRFSELSIRGDWLILSR